ncbi:DUF2971 domain-containing protein [Teredinibacter turnerae]|uniref:DUF2971 domain-containing protein n=1 Tax=Teredinibacter turnerae TaxID=2426 RepID=UPI0030CAFCCD
MADSEHIYCYKYLPFDEGSRKVITEGTIKYTCPLDFNDPFDCWPCYSQEALRELGQTKKKLIAQFGKSNGWSPAKRIREKRKLEAKVRQYIGTEKHQSDMLSQIGVVCLSRDPRNILMWSHYAKFHTGFVVEFKIPVFGYEEEAQKLGENLIPFPITYSKKRPVIKYGKENDEDLIDKSILTKYIDWSYEKEQRVIEHLRGPGIHCYQRESRLNSVISGMNISMENLKTLKNDVESIRKTPSLEHVKLYQAEPSVIEYGVDIPGLERNF